MAREVTHEATGPVRLDEDDIEAAGGSVLVCRCGLSAVYPFCDGSHEATHDETEGVLYEYTDGDDERKRREIADVVVVDENSGEDLENVEHRTDPD